MKTEEILEFVKKIDYLCKERRLKKKDFYEDVQITGGAVSQWKSGLTTPKIATVKRIADYFGVSMSYMLGNEETTGTDNEATEKKTANTVSESSLDERLVAQLMELNQDEQKLVCAYIQGILAGRQD